MIGKLRYFRQVLAAQGLRRGASSLLLELACRFPVLARIGLPQAVLRWGVDLSRRPYPAACYCLWHALNSPSRIKARKPTPAAPPTEITFTLCLPIYNSDPRLLEKTLNSIAEQTDSGWEVCAIDDGSRSDGWRDVFENFGRRYSERVRLLSNSENLGISASINRVLARASGKYFLVVDHDDLLHPELLAEARKSSESGTEPDLIYSDTALIDAEDRVFYVSFKPNYSPELLLNTQYAVHPIFFKTVLLRALGGCDEHYQNVTWDYDLLLRAAERASTIVHLPRALYYWRHHPQMNSRRLAERVSELTHRALSNALQRRNIAGAVEPGSAENNFRIRRNYNRSCSRISVLMLESAPQYTKRALDALERQSGVEIADTIVLPREMPWNFSMLYNRAAKSARGEILLFTADWLEAGPGSLSALLEYCTAPDTGAVAGLKVNPSGLVLEAGLALNFGTCLQSPYAGADFKRSDGRYLTSPGCSREITIARAPNLAVARKKFERAGGFDENFGRFYAGQDLCLRLREAGYDNIFTPFSSFEQFCPEPLRQIAQNAQRREYRLFLKRWAEQICRGDPYFNCNLSHSGYGFFPALSRSAT